MTYCKTRLGLKPFDFFENLLMEVEAGGQEWWGMEMMAGGRPKGLRALVLRWVGLVKGADLTEVRGPSTFEGLYTIAYHCSFFVFEAYAHDQPTRP